ncbi:MAG TPA: IS110 family transposase [Gemmatimonadaceae bacterium]|jgi:transposase|nr:IS110 family transposase [Gemmatimonadaceae bacterium]
MSTAATGSTQPTRTLHLALDLGNRTWKLAFATSIAHAPRLRTIPARDLTQLDAEVAAAKARFGLAPNAPVVSCYEAGRDGFWLHRALTARGIASHVVDAASITQNRRARRAKSDRLDATALVRLLLRHHGGERGVWSVVHVPSVEDEDRRQLHRELFTLTRQRTRQVNRIKGLLALHGIVLAKPRGLPVRIPELRDWSGEPLPAALAARVAREWTRLRAIQQDVLALRAARRALLDAPDAASDPLLQQVRRLLARRGVGEVSAWLYTTEFFGWRAFRNRREVAGLAGLTPTMRASGDLEREQGISKAGNSLIRALAIELAWSWVRRQPASALTRWYRERFAGGGPRLRRIGIVAVARKLLIALWRYLETGVPPEGAVFKA